MNNLNSPFLSIIIPTLNCSPTISHTIESIMSQSFQDYEIIILDGGSTDNTLDILKEYASLYLVIRWVSEKDNGIYDAMNKGVTMAKGQWLYFLGGDDLFYNEQILTEVFHIAENKDFDVLYGNVFLNKRKAIYNGEFDLQQLTFRNICHQAIFIKKKAFERIGNFNLKYKTLADYDHNIRWFTGESISKKYIDKVVAIYCEGGLSNNYVDLKFLIKKPYIFKKHTKQKLDFSYHYHLMGSLAIENVKKHNFLRGYFLSFIILIRISDPQYLKACLTYTKEYILKAFKHKAP